MSRATINISIPDIEDEKAIEIKREVEELVKEVGGVVVNLSLGPTLTPYRPPAA